jgi:hypothetical protein
VRSESFSHDSHRGNIVNVPPLFLLALMAILMAYGLVDLYLGGRYVCPSCGARREDRHGGECQWGR